jgi:hypothetical protein
VASYYVVDALGNVSETALGSSSGSADLSALNASNLTSGTVPLARLSGITNTEIDAAAAIAWTKLSKTGSSLADLTTKSAAALDSGTLPVARLANGVTTVVRTTATGNQDDWAPGLSGNTLVICNNASDLTIRGISGGVDGQLLMIVSGANTGEVYLAHQDTNSLAANRLVNFVTGTSTPLKRVTGVAIYQYDAGSVNRWRLVYHDTGGYIDVAHNAAHYTMNSTGTWTVASGDQIQRSYTVWGKFLIYIVRIAFSSVTTAAGADECRVALPSGFTAAVGFSTSGYANNNGTAGIGLVQCLSGETFTRSRTTTLGDWSNSTDASSVEFQLMIEVQ